MYPNTKDTKDAHTFFPLPHRRKHRVRKGLAEALGVLGLRPGEESQVEKDELSLPPLAPTRSPSVPRTAGRAIRKPFITVASPANESHSDTHSQKSIDTESDMAILDSFRKSRHRGSHSNRGVSPAPTIEKQDTALLSVPVQVKAQAQPVASRRATSPAPKIIEADRMSVNSSRTTLADTLITEEDEIKRQQRSVPQTRNITPVKVSQGEQITFVKVAFPGFQRKLREELKSSGDEWHADGVSIENFLSYIGGERLRRMPRKGSRWDKILKWAEFFATSLSFFEELVEGFLSFSKEAVELIFGCLRVLLQMGPSQGIAMERAFAIFNQFGLAFGFYLRNFALLSSMVEAREELGYALLDALTLVVEVTMLYHKSLRTMSTSSVVVDFNVQFGRTMDSFIQHKDIITNRIWTYQLRNSTEITDLHVSIEDIRYWLLPQDTVLQTFSAGRRGNKNIRAEFTCEWFERPLGEFFRGKERLLTISGETGAGKSVLSGWILERLQRPVGRKVYQTIECKISNQVPAQATEIALLKALLLQLLDQNVGNVALYRCLANVLELNSNTGNHEDAEDALWYVLDTALEPCKDVVLVVDGLDAIEDNETKQLKVFEKLHEVSTKHRNIRVIILTQPLSTPFPKPSRQVTINSGRTTQDVKYMTRSYLISRSVGTEREIEEISEQVAKLSKGSLTWADMTLQLLQKSKTITDMQTALKQVPGTIKEVMDYHLSLIPLKGEARLIISWMLVAKRPLTTVEIQNLLELNVAKGTHRPRSTNIIDDIQNSCGALVVVQDKTLYFRNESIRLHLLNVSKEGKQLLPSAEANRDITTRLLLYNKVCVTRNTEPSTDNLEPHQVTTLFRANPLLEYSVRNWSSHFKRSSYFADGQLQPVTPELKSVFPNSTLLALLERSCWEKQTLMAKANASHLLAFKIRKATLGENHRCVLQSSINVAKSFEKLSLPAAASEFYYQASRLGQDVLGKANELSVKCAISSVTALEGIKQKTRTDEVNRKEEMLRYIVDTEKAQYGANSTLATKYNNQLATLYTDIKEDEKAEIIYREVYKISLDSHGEFSGEAAAAGQKLSTVLYKGAKHHDVIKYQAPLFEQAEKTLEIFDIRRVEVTLRMAKSYAESGDVVSAEELYISLWRGLTEYCRSHGEASEAHERKIQVTVSYARFLKDQNRQAEAENILHGVWLDYQNRSNNSESLMAQLKVVGEELTAMGVLEVAIGVFKSICGWFKKSGKQGTAEAVAAATALVDTVEKKSVKRKEEKAVKAEQRVAAGLAAAEESDEDEHDVEAEAIMEEVVEAVTAAAAVKTVVDAASSTGISVTAGHGEVGQTTLQSCEKLSLTYMSKHQYAQAITVCQKLLIQLWPTMGQDGKIGFPKVQQAEAITFARRLALCYSNSHQTEQAEKVYTQIFLSARSSLRLQDALVAETAHDLIALYERTKQHQKALVVYQQLLEGYRTGLGARNALTIQTLYTIGDFCTKNRLKGADRYYLEITNASKDAKTGVIGHESLRAALTLSKIYYEQKRWEEARTLHATLWTTFTLRSKEYGISTEVAKSIYTRYTTVLTTLNVDNTTVRNVAVAYRDTCQATYGPHSEITTTANLQVAEISQKSPEHQAEAIKICEQVVAQAEAKAAEHPEKAKSAGQLEILAKAKHHLASLYSTATTASAESTAKAITLYKEQLNAHKAEHGASHKATLGSLAALVTIHARSEKAEDRATVRDHLHSSVVEVLTTEKESSKLLEAGNSLANMYISSNLTEQAWALLKDLRYQVMFKEARKDGRFTVRLPETVDRRAFVFIASFEETLRKTDAKSTVTFSDVMTDLLTEGILFDRYRLSLHSKEVAIQAKIFDGARVYTFLKGKHMHTEQCLAVETELYQLFTKNFGANIKTSPETTRVFVVALLEELGKHQRNEDLLVVGMFSGTKLVGELLDAEKFVLAYEVALCTYQFVSSTQGFSKPKNMASSFKLSLFLAGLGVKKTTDAELAGKMVELSKTVLRETLAACKSLDIDLVQLRASELNNLVRLMGEQKNYTDLEWLLTQLWNSRQLQASWSASTIISVGRRLVEVLFVRNKVDASIALCESMCYNLRRTWGLLDQVTIDLYSLLSSLYVAAGRHSDAMAIHEEILRTEISGDPDEQMSEEIASGAALQQLEFMKRIYARQGGWARDEDHSELVSQVLEEFAEDPIWTNVAGVESWSTKKPADHDRVGTFIEPNRWEFADTQEQKKLDYLPRWLRLNRQLSFGDLAFEGKDKTKN